MIAYYSRTFNPPEKQYCATRKELLAVVQAVQHFHAYLYGRHFIIRTDHAALKWLLSFKNPKGQVARWILRLEEYDYEIQHRQGLKHNNADALSRRPCLSQHCKYCDRLESKEAANTPNQENFVVEAEETKEFPIMFAVAPSVVSITRSFAQIDASLGVAIHGYKNNQRCGISHSVDASK